MTKNMLLVVGFFGSRPAWSSGGWSFPLDTGLDNDVLYFDAEDRSFTVRSADLKNPASSAVDWEGPLNQATEDVRAAASERPRAIKSRIFDRDVHRRQRWPLLP